MGIDFRTIPLSFFFFPLYLTIYLFAYFVLFKSWSSKFRPEAASCIISLSHSTPALLIATLSLLNHPYRDLTFASRNTQFQNLVLEYSISYFVMDLIHYLIFYPSDVLFIGHHLATLFVFVTCRFLVVHGAFAILGLLILAEVTSLFQNIWTLANAKRGESEFAAKVYDFLTLPFYSLYSVVRGLIGPIFVLKMFAFYLKGGARGVIPAWVWGSWIVVVVTAISVSVLWVYNLWVEFFKDTRREMGRKKKVR